MVGKVVEAVVVLVAAAVVVVDVDVVDVDVVGVVAGTGHLTVTSTTSLCMQICNY